MAPIGMRNEIIIIIGGIESVDFVRYVTIEAQI